MAPIRRFQTGSTVMAVPAPVVAPGPAGAIGAARRGAALIEMAVVAPLLVLLLMGIIEFGWLFYCKQVMVTAARVAARVATLPGTTEAEVRAEVDSEMTRMGFPPARYNYVVSISRATAEDPYETVDITIPYGSVSITGGFFNWLGIPSVGGRMSFRSDVAENNSSP